MSSVTPNFARMRILDKFSEFLVPVFCNLGSIKVAVVGGYPGEPELDLLRAAGVEFQVDFFGVDQSEITLDLNLESGIIQSEMTYDLVLCSQVLEHVYQHQNAFMHLSRLVKKSGYLWISCPASNKVHGEPDYYAAGFSVNYLESNMKLLGFKVTAKGIVGSQRLYFMVHAMRIWPNAEIYKHPIFFNLRFFLNRDYKNFLKNFLLVVLSACSSKKLTNSSTFATESWVLAENH